jgi:hypothetical protein
MSHLAIRGPVMRQLRGRSACPRLLHVSADSNRRVAIEARRVFAMFVNDCSFMPQGLGQERSAERAPRDGGNASRSAYFWERNTGVETCVGDGRP